VLIRKKPFEDGVLHFEGLSASKTGFLPSQFKGEAINTFTALIAKKPFGNQRSRFSPSLPRQTGFLTSESEIPASSVDKTGFRAARGRSPGWGLFVPARRSNIKSRLEGLQ